MSSLDRILPFLKPIDDLLRDPSVTEVMINAGGGRVFVERDGRLECVPGRTLEPRNLTVAIKNIARACGDEISDVQPILDARLEDGSRVVAKFYRPGRWSRETILEEHAFLLELHAEEVPVVPPLDLGDDEKKRRDKVPKVARRVKGVKSVVNNVVVKEKGAK